MHLTQILYSGLGGHGSVAFSLISGSSKSVSSHNLLFWGVEPCTDEYRDRCGSEKIGCREVRKRGGVDLRGYVDVYRALRSFGSQAVIVHSPGAVLPSWWYAKRADAALIVVEHQANAAKTSRDHIHSRIAISLSDAIVVLTDSYRAEFLQRHAGHLAEDRVFVIGNGIDTTFFSPPPYSSRPNANRLRVGMASRLTPLRDHLGLVQATALLKEVPIHLMVAGSGPSEAAIRQEIRLQQLDDRVSMTGLLGEPALLSFFHSLDVYVHASFHETMSTSIMQAMACGLPVVAYDVVGIREMVRPGVTGVLVEPNDPTALAQALTDMLRDQSTRSTMGENARRWALDHFSDNVMADNYLRLIAALESKKKRAP